MTSRASDPPGARAHQLLIEANQRLFEEQLRMARTERMSSVGLLAAGVAHEINNPLSGLLGCLKVLEQDDLPAERQRAYLAAMRGGLERIRDIVAGLLDYSRYEHPALREVDVAALVRASVRLLNPMASGREIRFRTALGKGPWHVLGDESQLMQAVVNVLLNAVQASPDRGLISIRAEEVGSHRLALHVADRGPGIAPDDVGRVLEPFFTTKPEGEGTGLGLSVTVAILQNHGGELKIGATRGGGATVSLVLPLM